MVTVPSRCTENSSVRGGCRNDFHDCGPAEWANAYPSSRRHSRYPPGASVTPQPYGNASADSSSASTIAWSRTVGPITRYSSARSVATSGSSEVSSTGMAYLPGSRDVCLSSDRPGTGPGRAEGPDRPGRYASGPVGTTDRP